MQDFEPDEAYVNFEKESLKANIISCSLSLERILNNWLSLNCGYKFTKRNSDFARDGFSDNQVTLSLRANY